MRESIEELFSKYHIPIVSVTPIAITFIPCYMKEKNILSDALGNITWNPISSRITVRFILIFKEYSIFKDTGDFKNHNVSEDHNEKRASYSRFLKWYLLQWNEKRSDGLRSDNLQFVYPGDAASEVILQTSRRVSTKTIAKTIRAVLFQLSEAADQEIHVIDAILRGRYPPLIKQEMLSEIDLALSEINAAAHKKQ